MKPDKRLLAAVGGLVAAAAVGAGVWAIAGAGGGGSARNNGAIGADAGVIAIPLRVGADAGPGPISGGERLSGTVIDLRAQGVDGALVSVRLERGATTPRDTVTDAAGGFELTGLAPGSYRLIVEGAAVIPAEVRQVDVPGGAVTVMVARRVLIEGVVSDDGAPAQGATVEVTGAGLWAPRQVVAGADGHFLIDDLAEGTYVVAARKGARAVQVPVERLGAGPHDSLPLALQPAALVEGHVVDAATRVAVAGAHVALVPDDGPVRTAVADADGAFSLEGVLPGTWAVDVVAPGYLPPAVDGLDVGEGQTLAIELPVARGGTASGRVVGASGAPVAGARVDLVGDAKGGKKISVSVSGRARRYARVFGVVERAAAEPGSGAGGSGPGAGAGPGPDVEGYVAIGELGVTTGPVPFAPPRGVRVAVRREDDEPAAPVDSVATDAAEVGLVTDADGRFRVDGLQPGRYVARAWHADFAGGESAGFAVSERPGGEVKIVMSRGAAVEGRVLDAGGALVAGAEVSAWRGDTRAASTRSDGQGRYRLERLSGPLRLRAEARGAADAEVELAIGAADEGHVLTRDLTLGALGAATSGRVEDPLGHALAGATVTALMGGRARANAQTDAYGHFDLYGLPAGRVELQVTHADYPLTRVPDQRVGARDLRVVLAAGGGVDGVVRDAHTGGRIAAFELRASGPDGSERVQQHKAGEFELAPVVPGRWTLRFAAKGYAATTLTVDVPAGRGARAVSVPELRVQLAQGATVAGTVFDAHGEIVAGAAVECGGVRGTSDKHGRFRLADVPSGDVTVSAAAADGRKGKKVVPLRPGDELLTVQIKLD